MSDTSPPTVPAASEPKSKQPRSAQDKIIGAYGAAGKDPFAAKFTNRGYPTAGLATLLEYLDDLTSTGSDQDTALGDAIEDNAGRDEAYAKLKAFMKELKGTARGALRKKPGLLAKLEL
jgi:hypothetical protein